MMTVFPTPAPPNRPILPPFTNGAIKSMTLIPVSNTSVLGSRSTNFGVSRWIGQRSASAGMGSPSSTGSPRTVRGPARPPRPPGTGSGWFRCSRPPPDSRQLLRDLRLPRPIVGALQQLDDVTGVVGGVLHRRPLRAEERRRGFHQRPVDLVPHVEGQELLQNGFGRGLEDVIGGRHQTDPGRESG